MLDDLVEVIELLRERIRAHGGSLRENETRTRMALIDPAATSFGMEYIRPEIGGAGI